MLRLGSRDRAAVAREKAVRTGRLPAGASLSPGRDAVGKNQSALKHHIKLGFSFSNRKGTSCFLPRFYSKDLAIQ